MNKKEMFLKELGELSKKYNMYIGGCGCCSSPYIDDENGKELFTDLTWNSDKQEYGEE
jgi:hypothetical protein